MRPKPVLRFTIASVRLAVIVLLASLLFGQERDPGPPDRIGLFEDWTGKHVVFSNETSPPDFVLQDPRFWMQYYRRHVRALGQSNASSSPGALQDQDARNAAQPDPGKCRGPKCQPPPGQEIDRDWSNVMGGGSGIAATGSGDTRTYPAKFSFDISAKDCVNDFIVFTTDSGGATSTGNPYQTTGTFAAPATAGETFTITNTLYYTQNQVLTLTADASVNTGLKFAVGVSDVDAATNLANAIARNGGRVGMTATSFGAVVTVNSITANVQSSVITPSETSATFSWGAETNGTPSPGHPTIFALNQLYAETVANGGCQTSTQAVPATFWSYKTGTGAIADLSPVLSFFDNGAQVAFMQRVGSASSLVLLKWSSSSPGTLGAPATPSTATLATYRSCTAPCMVTLSLGANDTNSAPFVDYDGDTLYVGDDTGKLHKFSGVFQGTPAEVVSAGVWPAQVAATTSILSSPVYDAGSGLVFVGSNGPNATTGNKLHSVAASTGAVVSSGAIGSSSSGASANGVRDAPIVDSTAQRVYAFIGGDNAATDSLGNTCGSGNTCNAVYQFVTTSSLATQNSGLGAGLGAKIVVGKGSNSNNLNSAINSGGFDDAYYSSGGTGSLYVCGSQPTTDSRFTLWKIAITSGSFSARTLGPQIYTPNVVGVDVCSPVTTFKNGSTESLFVSVANGGSAVGGGGCTEPGTGCVYAYQLPLAASFDTTDVATNVPDTTPRYASVSTSVALNTTESSVATTLTAAEAGTYGGMKITVGGPVPNPFIYTLRKNGSDTAITCTISSLTTCSDTSHTVSYAAGDTIDVKVQRTTGTSAFTKTIQVKLDTAASGALHAEGGTGGIVIDNTLTGGGSQVYYSTRTGPGIAVQASQAGLQ